jgi:hypothetical protein
LGEEKTVLKLSPAEKQILEECCREFNITPQALYALLFQEWEGYYSNESQKSKIVPGMVNLLKFWAAKEKKETR